MQVRPAQAVLNEIRRGAMLDELAQHIHDAIAAVNQFGKPATVTISLGIKPWTGDANLVHPPIIMTAEVESKLPKEKPEATVFFTDADGNPTRNQERQPELSLSVAQIGSRAAAGGSDDHE